MQYVKLSLSLTLIVVQVIRFFCFWFLNFRTEEESRIQGCSKEQRKGNYQALYKVCYKTLKTSVNSCALILQQIIIWVGEK